jgi:hypothetical protein
MAYNYEIKWKDPENFPGTAFKNASERCRVYSELHPGIFSVYSEPEGSEWLFYSMRGSYTPLDRPLISFQGGIKIFPNE